MTYFHSRTVLLCCRSPSVLWWRWVGRWSRKGWLVWFTRCCVGRNANPGRCVVKATCESIVTIVSCCCTYVVIRGCCSDWWVVSDLVYRRWFVHVFSCSSVATVAASTMVEFDSKCRTSRHASWDDNLVQVTIRGLDVNSVSWVNSWREFDCECPNGRIG